MLVHFPAAGVHQEARYELRVRTLLVLLVVAALVPALAFSSLVLVRSLRQERENAERAFLDTARALAVAVDVILERSQQTLAALATSRELAAGDLRAFRAEAGRVRRNYPDWQTLTLTDARGADLLEGGRAAGAPAGRARADEVAGTTGPRVTSAAGSQGPPVLTVQMPVVVERRVRYVLSATLKPAVLNELFARQGIPTEWTGAILDRRGIIIARSRAADRFVGHPATEVLRRRSQAAVEGSFWDVTKEGIPAFGVFSRSRLSGWTIVLGIPAETAAASLRRPLWALLGGGSLLLLGGTGLAALLGRRVARAIAALAPAMHALGRGEQPAIPARLGVAELDGVTHAIAQSADRLRREAAERDRAERALRSQTEILQLLNQIGPLIAAELDQEKLVQAVTDAATQVSRAAFGAFFYNVVDERGESYTLYTLSGAPREAFARFPMPRNTALFGPTFRGDRVIRLDDVTKDARYGRSAPFHGMPPGHLPVRSYLAVPVVSCSGAVLGGLFLGHPEPGVFGERDEQVVAGLAAQAAIAIDNARLYEREQRARAEAEAASRLKDEFLATLSHELRTPLTAIIGWVRILRTARWDDLPVERALEVIDRNASAQARLVEDLLDVSRIVRGKLRLETRRVEPAAVIRAAIDAVHPAAEARGIAVEAALDAGAGPVLGDPDRLQQVMWNLLSNAVKFTERGGRVRVGLERADGRIAITVADTGQGIPADVLPFIFDRFRQADSSSTRAQGGLGLGLALVRHLVELHGGAVRAESPGPGRGATFTVTLPAVARTAASHGSLQAGRREDRAPAS